MGYILNPRQNLFFKIAVAEEVSVLDHRPQSPACCSRKDSDSV